MHRDTAQMEGRTLCVLLAVGVVVWVATGGGMFLFSDHGYGAFIGLFLPTSGGYLPGGLALVVYGVVQRWRGRLRTHVLLWAAIAYFLPVVLVLIAWSMVGAMLPEVQHDPGVAGLQSWALALVGLPGTLPYLVGLWIGFAQRKRGFKPTTFGLLAPPWGMSACYCMILLWTIIASPVWPLRKDCVLSNEQVAQQPGRVVATAALQLNRNGQYHFQAMYEESWAKQHRTDSIVSHGTGIPIEWLDADHQQPQSAGTYRFRLSWPRASGETPDLPLRLQPTHPSSRQQFLLRVYTVSPDTHSGLLLIREFHMSIR